ncbi:MAG: LamG-like jellyroll fold domain-containing protein [Acidimicrobiia bacterium]|nr:LamG-like jellyroll fold domain-containing protein [Acidimicrobiia bacterium]
MAGADLGNHTLLATLTGTTDSNTTKTFSPNSTELVDHVEAKRSGTSRILLNSVRTPPRKRPRFVTSPSSWSSTSADESGTTDDPRLVIEHVATANPTLDATLGALDAEAAITATSPEITLDATLGALDAEAAITAAGLANPQGDATLDPITATAQIVYSRGHQRNGIPDVRIDIAWDDDYDAADPTWTRIDDTCCPRSLQITRGIRMRTGEIETGEARIVLDNRSRDLDPNNPDSIWWPNVLPRRRIRITLLPDGLSRRAFTGWIDRIDTRWDIGDGWVEITVVDLLGILASASPLPPAITTETLDSSPIAYWPLTDRAGTTAIELVDAADGTYRRDVANTRGDLIPYDDRRCMIGTTPNAEDDPVGQAMTAAGAVDTKLTDAATMRCWFRFTEDPTSSQTMMLIQRSTTPLPITGPDPAYGLGAGPGGIVGWIGGSDIGTSGTIFGSSADDYYPADGNWHHLLTTVTASEIEIWVDGEKRTPLTVDPTSTVDIDAVLAAVTTASAGWSITIGATNRDGRPVVGHFAIWDRVLTPAEIANDYDAGAAPYDGDTTGARLERVLDLLDIDAVDSDVDPGREICSPYRGTESPTDALRQIAATEDGTMFIAADGRLTFRQRPVAEVEPTTIIFVGDPDIDEGTPYIDIDPRYGIDRIVNVVEIERDDGSIERRESSTWRQALGQLSLTLDTLHRSATAARAQADRILARSAEPRTTIESVELAPGDPRVSTSVALDTELGDVIEVSARPTGGGDPIVQRAKIEHIEHMIDWQGWDWRIRFGLDEWPARLPPASDPALTIDDPTRAQFDSEDSIYADARAGGGTLDVDTDPEYLIVGQRDATNYHVHQAIVSFDLAPWADTLGNLATYFALELSATAVVERELAAAANRSGIASTSATYSTARSGGGLELEADSPRVGQRAYSDGGTVYEVMEVLAEFDVSILPDAPIDSTAVTMWIATTAVDTAFDVEVREEDYGDEITTADWVAGANLSGLTLLASVAAPASPGQVEASGETALATAIETARAGDGKLRVVVASSRTRVGNTPTGDEYVTLLYSNPNEPTGIVQLVVDIEGTDTPFTVEARLVTPGDPITTGDWVAGIDIASQELVASRDTDTATAWTFTSESGFITALDAAEGEQIAVLLSSSRQRTGDAPTGNEVVVFDPSSVSLRLVIEEES